MIVEVSEYFFYLDNKNTLYGCNENSCRSLEGVAILCRFLLQFLQLLAQEGKVM